MTLRKRHVAVSPYLRRQQLIDAAALVFATRGYRAAGVSDIVSAAGVARGTFYLYFEGKAQVFLGIADDFYDRLEQAVDLDETPPSRTDAADGRAVLRASFRRWFEFFHRSRHAAAVILKEAPAVDPRFDSSIAALRQTAVAHFAGRFRRFQELGLARASLSPDIAAHLQIGMFEELVKTFMFNADEPDLDALADQMADFEWNGVRPAGR
jgi:AcrR family transcriptional regulator